MFIITDSAHRDCADCRDLMPEAITAARMSGATTARYTVDDRGRSTSHWCEVTRA